MELDKDWIETLLVKHSTDNSVKKVLNIQEEKVVSKGDHYASDMVRAKMDVILGSGKRTKKSVIVKSVPSSTGHADMINKMGAFKKEIKMFTVILPAMEELMEEIGDYSSPMWSQCYHVTPYKQLVLEDLKELGYRMPEKRRGMNLEEATLTVKSLAKFHAMSVALNERGLLDPKDYNCDIFIALEDMLQTFHDQAFEGLASAIETTWEPEWLPYAAKIRRFKGISGKMMKDIYAPEDKEFKVLNHADFWCNNMMIKYDDENRPISFRFVDFQISYFNSCSYDLHYLFTSSLSNETRRKYSEKLLEIYHETLFNYSRKLSLPENKIPSLETVKMYYKKDAFFSFILAVTALTFMLTEPEDAPDIEKLITSMEKNDASEPSPISYKSKLYTERVKSVLEDCVNQGII